MQPWNHLPRQNRGSGFQLSFKARDGLTNQAPQGGRILETDLVSGTGHFRLTPYEKPSFSSKIGFLLLWTSAPFDTLRTQDAEVHNRRIASQPSMIIYKLTPICRALART